MQLNDASRRQHRWRRVLFGALILLTTIAAFALAGWLLGRAFGEQPDNAKARAEVQRFYDRRWPGQIKVENCRYWDDPEGSIFDQYDCQVSVRCPSRVSFSVPRASTLGRFDADAVPMGKARPPCGTR